MMDFRESLKTFKPKQSTMEIGIFKSRDDERITKLKDAL